MEVQEKIIEWVKQNNVDMDRQMDLSGTSDLLGSGLLDSLDFLQLITYIEDEFDLRIPVEALTPDNFSTPASIRALVGRIMA